MERVGAYRIVRRLSHGQAAEVCVAVREGPGGVDQQVCLKRLRPDVARDPQLRALFATEAQVATRLQHRSIVPVLEFGEADGCYFLATALVPGTDLRSLLAANGRLPPAAAALVALDVAEALAHAHALVVDGVPYPVVHGKVTPTHVLVSRFGEAVLTDFGLARAPTAAEMARSPVDAPEPWYLSPEQAANGAVDARTDQFSLGVVLYEMLTGRRPFGGMDEQTVVQAILRGERPPLQAGAPDAPGGLVALVDKLLAADPAQRYPDLPSVIDGLAALAPPPAARRELGAMAGEVASRQARAMQGSAALGPEPAAPQPPPGGPGAPGRPATPTPAELLSALPVGSSWTEQDEIATTSVYYPGKHGDLPVTPNPVPPAPNPISPPVYAMGGGSPSAAAVRAAPVAAAPPPAMAAVPPPPATATPPPRYMIVLLVAVVLFTLVAIGTMLFVRYGMG